MARLIEHMIAGKKTAGVGTRRGDVFNPATGEKQAEVAFADAADVDAAVKAGLKAFPDWAASPPARRARVLFAFRELIERNMDELARIVTAEHGKIISDAKGSITRGLEVVEFACGIRSC